MKDDNRDDDDEPKRWGGEGGGTHDHRGTSWRRVAGQNNTTIKQFVEDWVDGDGEE